MKTQSTIKQTALLFVSLGLFLFTSCSKSSNQEPDPEVVKPVVEKGVTATLNFDNGTKVDYVGAVITAVWTKDDDVNILSIIAVDEAYKGAVLTIAVVNADEPGTYAFDAKTLISSSAKLIWGGMDFDNWMGFGTGDINGDGISDGSGTLKITTLNNKETNGTFSMVMGNDLGKKVTVKGKFNCPVMRIVD